MLTLFTIQDNFTNNTKSKELFVKSILASRHNKFESFEDGIQTILLRGRSEVAIQVALLKISDDTIVMTSTYDKPIKILIILTLILALTSSLVFISENIFHLGINKDFKVLLIIHPILTIVIFIASRLALYFKRNQLIDDLKRSKLICT
jgi:hypothetical protein